MNLNAARPLPHGGLQPSLPRFQVRLGISLSLPVSPGASGPRRETRPVGAAGAGPVTVPGPLPFCPPASRFGRSKNSSRLTRRRRRDSTKSHRTSLWLGSSSGEKGLAFNPPPRPRPSAWPEAAAPALLPHTHTAAGRKAAAAVRTRSPGGCRPPAGSPRRAQVAASSPPPPPASARRRLRDGPIPGARRAHRPSPSRGAVADGAPRGPAGGDPPPAPGPAP